MNQVYSIPILTREQELDLTREFYETEDVKIAHKLVISHLRFVVHIAKSYAGYGLPIADIIQEGTLSKVIWYVNKFPSYEQKKSFFPCRILFRLTFVRVR